MNDFIYYYCLVIASLFLFLHGFFPMQQHQVTNPVQPPRFLNNIEFNVSEIYKEQINRVVMIVIDALRLDFITTKNMPFLLSTYTSQGCMLTVHVESPTVTLPRIKALTTGGIPQFVDIILNLASTEILTDSFLHRVKEAGKKIIFYGDDTWAKLYPKIFERFEGVSSFYVSDYTEVDDNVTRNVVKELNNEDWDIMLLHYLGLDHIGHVYGPYSQLVPPKLKEMDNIIEKIYQTSKTWDRKTLIVVTGDHGMKDSGGHGGSTTAETHVPFVVFGNPCKADSIAQTDVPSTLAALMGLTFPSSSIGRIISNMFITLPFNRLLYILRYNALFLKAKTEDYDISFDEATILHYNFLRTHNENDAIRAQKLYEECSRKISDTLLCSSVKQDVQNLLIGSALLISCFCAMFYNIIEVSMDIKRLTKKIEQIVMTTIFVLQFILPKFLFLTTIYLVVINVFVIRYIILTVKTIKQKPHCDFNILVIFGTILQSLSLLSSSFIEEEHQVWYFLWGTFVMLSGYFILHEWAVVQWLLLFLSLRILRTINQTGDKWAHLPDLSQWLLLEENYYYFQLLTCISLMLIWCCCFSLYAKQKRKIILCTVIVSLISAFHIFGWGTQNVFLVKLIWFFLILNLILGLTQGSHYVEHVIVTWILFCALLMRSYNLILLPACVCASIIACKHVKNVTTLTVIHIWLEKMLFFCQGHSNSLASIDVASGYIGIEDYIPSVVIMQVLCHTYTFPVLTNLLLLRNSFLYANCIWMVNIVCRLLVLIITCILILIQRHHLFVWTVFAPKLLIESCHSAVLFLQIVIFYCTISMHKIFVNFFKI